MLRSHYLSGSPFSRRDQSILSSLITKTASRYPSVRACAASLSPSHLSYEAPMLMRLGQGIWLYTPAALESWILRPGPLGPPLISPPLQTRRCESPIFGSIVFDHLNSHELLFLFYSSSLAVAGLPARTCHPVFAGPLGVSDQVSETPPLPPLCPSSPPLPYAALALSNVEFIQVGSSRANVAQVILARPIPQQPVLWACAERG